MIMTYTITIAQNQIWTVGNQSMYYDPLFGPVTNSLPTPAGPSGLDYAGQQAQYAANAWHHPQTGALLFFVVDGVVYDNEGYYLGTLNVNNDTDPTTKRIMGFSEVSIVPDPGDCKRFYIIGSSPNASFLNSPPAPLELHSCGTSNLKSNPLYCCPSFWFPSFMRQI